MTIIHGVKKINKSETKDEQKWGERLRPVSCQAQRVTSEGARCLHRARAEGRQRVARCFGKTQPQGQEMGAFCLG